MSISILPPQDTTTTTALPPNIARAKALGLRRRNKHGGLSGPLFSELRRVFELAGRTKRSGSKYCPADSEEFLDGVYFLLLHAETLLSSYGTPEAKHYLAAARVQHAVYMEYDRKKVEPPLPENVVDFVEYRRRKAAQS